MSPTPRPSQLAPNLVTYSGATQIELSRARPSRIGWAWMSADVFDARSTLQAVARERVARK